MSVGELRGIASRHKDIRYQRFDPSGNLIVREVSEFHARVFQHKYDHLDGVLFVDRLKDTQSLDFLSVMKALDKE